MVIVYYQGQRRRAYIVDYLTRGGETYAEAIIEGFKVVKCIHISSIKSKAL